MVPHEDDLQSRLLAWALVDAYVLDQLIDTDQAASSRPLACSLSSPCRCIRDSRVFADPVFHWSAGRPLSALRTALAG
jgi:hypothetical protein